MERRLLLTRSRHDIANQYLYAYSEEIISEAGNRGWKVFKAEDRSNTASEFDSRLEKNKPNFIFFNGHGDDGAVSGIDNEILVDIPTASKLSGTVVFARSCSALSSLGKSAVESGCTAFVGYRGSFIVPHLDEYESLPLQNPLARPVMEVSNLVGLHILKGDTVANSVASAQNKAAELMLKTLASKEQYDAFLFVAGLLPSVGDSPCAHSP
jgi:hypothetical protein